ncbi:hypothetical protein D7D52_16800 [Nocardia yunnanensis]|uniref:DUF892 family protein n=1 Tax=Nocardia yunnanensis TaxID=2382165 RepID=A0A386ZBL6_9NOCA|nr:hypothetical protein [Nocardia yunnanensis]AYF75252.1 hypothetical protein D7D52_16800 [Nocardia yunnanensis]
MDRFLRIYMNDQLAMGVLWRQLARRTRDENRGTAAEPALRKVASEIAEDVETFRDIMRRLGLKPNPVKAGLVIGGERLARLKPNGRLTGYSPLSRFTELEFLVMGIEGKKQLWTTLRDIAGLGRRLPEIDFDELIERAQHQRTSLEPLRASAGAQAFGTENSPLSADSDSADTEP